MMMIKLEDSRNPAVHNMAGLPWALGADVPVRPLRSFARMTHNGTLVPATFDPSAL